MDNARWKVTASALVILLLAPVFLLPDAYGAAFTVKGELRTVLESYDDPEGDAAAPLYQYFRLTMEDGPDAAQAVRLYGRLADDLADEMDVRSRLYFAYYERRGLWGNTDLRIGRQWVTTVAGSPIVDGVYVKHRMPGTLSLALFGGGWVTVDDDLSNDTVWGFVVGEDFWPKVELSA